MADGVIKGARMKYIAIGIDILAAVMWAYKGNMPMTMLFLALIMIITVTS